MYSVNTSRTNKFISVVPEIKGTKSKSASQGPVLHRLKQHGDGAGETPQETKITSCTVSIYELFVYGICSFKLCIYRR